jgi:type II pantothenate kinase
MLSDAGRVVRIGGTALGGGTLLGLGRRLAGCTDFAELCRLAERGDRWRVDLSVADVYAGGQTPPLAAELTASAFARLGREAGARPEDLAAALVWMVGENVALIAGGLAGAAGVDHIVVGGGTLHGNPLLHEAIADIAGRFGRHCTFLDDGAYGAALGALLAAEAAGQAAPVGPSD